MFQVNGVKKEPLVLPEPTGEPITLTEKVFVPVKDHPEVSVFEIIIRFYIRVSTRAFYFYANSGLSLIPRKGVARVVKHQMAVVCTRFYSRSALLFAKKKKLTQGRQTGVVDQREEMILQNTPTFNSIDSVEVLEKENIIFQVKWSSSG